MTRVSQEAHRARQDYRPTGLIAALTGGYPARVTQGRWGSRW